MKQDIRDLQVSRDSDGDMDQEDVMADASTAKSIEGREAKRPRLEVNEPKTGNEPDLDDEVCLLQPNLHALQEYNTPFKAATY